jgi:hypothetical protein
MFPQQRRQSHGQFLLAPRNTGLLHLRNLLLFVMIRFSLIYITTETLSQKSRPGKVSRNTSGMYVDLLLEPTILSQQEKKISEEI